ncbi:MAG: hypothetical protein JNL62_11410 [Bryobacterales bacterium]|nr:hypothetical protein [Bryobacterales bacterium]
MTRVTLAWMVLVARLCGQDEMTMPTLSLYHPAEEWRGGRFSNEDIAEIAAGSLAIVEVAHFGFTCLIQDKTRVQVVVGTDTGGREEAEVLSVLHCGGVQVRIPARLALGTADVTLRYRGVEAGTGKVEIVRSYFDVLGPVGDAMGERVRLARAAAGGAVISVLGTGLGEVEPGEVHGELDGRALTLVDVHRERNGAGMDALRFRLPDDLAADGCYVPVAVRVAGKWSDVLPVAVNRTGGACRHPLGLPVEQMETLDSGRSIGLGQVMFSSQGERGWRYFEAGVAVAGWEAVAEAAFDRHAEGCRSVPQYRRTPYTVMLDGGAVTARGPGGVSRPEVPVQGGFAAGDYEVSAPGGEDVLPFAVKVRIPEVPQAAQRLRLLEGGDLLMEWDGEKYAMGDVVTVSARDGREPGFLCKAPARAGRMAIPGRAEEHGWVEVGVERSKQIPLLFPVILSNGARFSGVVGYRVSEEFRVTVQRGGQQ